MTKKMIRKIALVLAIAMITQCGFGLKLFSIDVKASTGTANTVTEIEAGSIEATTGQNENTGSGDTEEVAERQLKQLQMKHHLIYLQRHQRKHHQKQKHQQSLLQHKVVK